VRFNNDIVKNNKKDKKKEFTPCSECVQRKASGFLVYDHDHITGKYRGSACNSCNLNHFRLCAWDYLTSVFFHNGEGYDFHFIIRNLLENGMKLHPDVLSYLDEIIENKDLVKHLSTKSNINAIPRSGEKILNFNTGLLNFKDSCKLVIGALDDLIYNLTWIEPVICKRKECSSTIKNPKCIVHDKTHFIGEFICRSCKEYGHELPAQYSIVNKQYVYKNMRALTKLATIDKVVNDDRLALLLRKGTYPYNYMDSLEKYEQGPPPIEAFHNDLKDIPCHIDDYNHFLKVYNIFECKNMRDYEKIYLLTDVAGLADVMENNSESGMKNFGLDPANFITNSSFADATQKFITYKKHIEVTENRLDPKGNPIHKKPFDDNVMCTIPGKEHIKMNEWVMNEFPEQLSDKSMYDLFTKNIRGGLCNKNKKLFKEKNLSEKKIEIKLSREEEDDIINDSLKWIDDLLSS